MIQSFLEKYAIPFTEDYLLTQNHCRGLLNEAKILKCTNAINTIEENQCLSDRFLGTTKKTGGRRSKWHRHFRKSWKNQQNYDQMLQISKTLKKNNLKQENLTEKPPPVSSSHSSLESHNQGHQLIRVF